MNKHDLLSFKRSVPLVFDGTVATFAAVGALMVFAPIFSANAERINVNVGDGAYYMNITAADLSVDIDATPAGVKKTVQNDVTIDTNSGTGYKLYLSMDNADTDGNRLYYDGNAASTDYISATTSTSLSTNSWGYSIDGTSFSAVPLQGNEVVIGSGSSATASAVSHPVYYGFYINNTLPFGTYSGVVTYTAVADAAASPTARTSVSNYLDDKSKADPAGGDTLVITTSLMTNIADLGTVTVSVGGTNCPVTSTSTANKYAEVSCTMPAKTAGTYAVAVTLAKFDKTYSTNITYDGNLFGTGNTKIRTMQGMTTAVCNSVATPATSVTSVPTGRLRDTRDTNSYYVKKLADGNCWMDQNLNLDLGTPTTTANSANTTFKLTSADTDINYNNYKGSTAASANQWTPPYNTQLNYNTSWAQDGSDGAKSFSFRDDANTGGDKGAGTAGRYWNGASSYATTGDVRNHFGNYYNWPAATAGTGTSSSTSTTVGDSICPKGWQLPLNENNKSFNNLIRTVYGISSTTSDASVIAEPLHFIRSGYYSWSGGSLNNQGTNGNYWSASATSTATNAYNLNFNASNLNPQNANNKGNGLTVRCVAR